MGRTFAIIILSGLQTIINIVPLNDSRLVGLAFLPCDALRCTVFVIVILSVSLSVRLSHSWTVPTWFDLRS